MSRPAPVTLWIFEDQLSNELSTLKSHPDAPVLLIESGVNMRRVPYHKKRLTFLVSAMRHFADELRSAGREVAHYPLHKKNYLDSLSAIRDHVRRTKSNKFLVVRPSEYHCQAWLNTLPDFIGIEIEFVEDDLFLVDRSEFADWARGLKSPVMENFYRRQRAEHRVLMDGHSPVGGTWNLDKLNRKPPPKKKLNVPPVPRFKPDEITRQAMADVEQFFPTHPGSTSDFDLPVTHAQAEASFADFLDLRLPTFGDYEDAMVTGEPYLFHSFLSPLLNAGLLSPLPMVRAAEARFRDGRAPLHCVEGFVRQILGWREYVYGIYWTFMPEYRERNARKSTRSLPLFMWDAKTELNCLKQTVGDLLKNAYTHHIQRLMVICNFATLAGLSPQAVSDWFLAMYADSHDWVVVPNVVGMAMNADGGTMATKPYVSSAAYINRMSDYCRGCVFDPAKRTGDDACPFNFLYWTFLQHYRKQWEKNPRMTMMLKNVERIDADEMSAMMKERKRFIEALSIDE